MAIFQLPEPPPGQAYVTKQTANGPTTVLVDKSTLSEDICAATGRTWAEEARLYNIRNAPDGKPIAEPGDPFYQTAESMKNRDKAIGSGLNANTLKLLQDFSATSDASGPNLSETMAKIKNGSINADITSSLSKIVEVAGSLGNASDVPPETIPNPLGPLLPPIPNPEFASFAAQPGNLGKLASAKLESIQSAIGAQMAAAQAQLPKLTAQVQANIDILTKQKLAETGQPPTEAEIKAASAPLAIFQDGPALIKSKAEELSKTVAQAGAGFGVELPKGLPLIENVGGVLAAGLDKVTDLAKTAGAAISSFASGVPPETIPNPLNPSGPPIPNPAFAAFSAIPGNASKLAGLADLAGGLESLAGGLESSFGALIEEQVSAIDTSTSNLKAFGFAASLAKKAVGLAATVQSVALDPTAFDAASIKQTFASSTTLAPAIDTAFYKNTKDEDLTYTGDDGLVWDRIDAERQRRSLPGLAAIGTPRPLEPPRPSYGTTPKDDTVPKVGPKLASLDSASTAAPPPAKKIVFDKNADDKISTNVINLYDRSRKNFNVYLEEQEKIAFSDAEIQKFFGSIDFLGLRKKANKIKEDKPDESTRTAEEKLIIKQREYYSAAYESSKAFGEYAWSVEAVNFIEAQYGILYGLWDKGKKYKDVPLTVEEAIFKDGGLGGWTKTLGQSFFDTFEQWKKANPDSSLPTA